jgi:transposase
MMENVSKKPKYSKLTKQQIDKLIEAFALGLPALTASGFAGVHRNTASKFYLKIRKRIAELSTKHIKKLQGEVEVDESYFGGRQKGQRGRGAAHKQIVFGILERKGQVRTIIVTDVSAATLMKEIKDHTEKGCVYYTDQFRSYNSVNRFGKHIKINHAKYFVRTGRNHINGIEGFWSYAKRFLRKYNGVSPRNFALYLKEIEWRFNNRNIKNLAPLIHQLL